MKKYYRYVIVFGILAALGITLAIAAEQASNAGSARVSFLQGKGFKSKAKDGPWTPIKQGSVISAGFYVKADENSKIELTLPDNSKMRIAPKSVLFLSSARMNKGARSYEAQVAAGSVYTRATPSQKKEDKFVVRSGGAVAGIRGTSFDTILMPDNATQVKCFEGKVWVATWADYAQRFLKEPQKIPTAGSLEAPVVPGPDVVTEEEWVRIAGAMMSVTVGSDGKIQDPAQMNQSDVNDWEDWNRKRDAM